MSEGGGFNLNEIIRILKELWQGSLFAKALAVLSVILLVFGVFCWLGHESPPAMIADFIQLAHPTDKMKKCEQDYEQWKVPSEREWKDLTSEEKIEKCNEFETLDSNEKKTLASSSNKWSEGI
jgi:hypothetical protein